MMRINFVIVAFLIIVALATGVYFLQKGQSSSDDQQYVDNLALINRLKHANTDLDILLLKSRYGLQADYDDLAKESNALIDDLKLLKSSALVPYIANNQKLKNALSEYEEKVLLKIDLIESFKSHNAILRNSIKYAPPLGDSLVSQIESSHATQATFLSKVNKALYRWSLYHDESQAKIIQENASKILDLLPLYQANETPLLEYNSHVIAVVDEKKQTQSYLEKALLINAEDVLLNLEQLYTEDYLAQVESSNQVRNYSLLGFGLLALLAALYFAWLLKKSYSSLEDKVKVRTEEINKAYKELKDSQEHLIQSEKMASLGQMVAGVAHEINTPLGYVNNNVSIVNNLFMSFDTLMKGMSGLYKEAIKPNFDKKALSQLLVQVLRLHRRMDKDGIVAEAKELLDDSSLGLNDISELVKNLRSFSRVDRQSMERFDLQAGIDSALKIANNMLLKADVQVEKNYTEDALMECNPSKMNQVFLNIITNAIQAMPETGGQLIIDVKKVNDEKLVIDFADNGEGMDEETQAKIFDPFFTTKAIGEGTGLGMAISYRIVSEHNGQIRVESQQNIGTTISLELPTSST
jgi:signal transduction histidine kinase